MAAVASDSSIPGWKAQVLQLKNTEINTLKAYNKQFVYGQREVGLRHPATESHIKIFDNGNIEMFAGDRSGIIVSDKHDTTNLYGDTVNVNAQDVYIRTKPLGLIWNGYALNPQLYQLLADDLLLDGSVRYWVEATEKIPAHWARRQVAIKPFIKSTADDEFDSILSQLGIPT